MTPRRLRLLVVVSIIGAGVAFFACGGYSWTRSDGNVENLLTDTGVLGPLLFIVVMWLTQPLGIPGFVYMAPAGIVWPDPLAVALAWIGNMGASTIAFYFARWFARDWVEVRIPTRMRVYDDRLQHGGVWPVVVVRLLFGQFPPADWLLGVSSVSTRNFLIGTGIGIIPGVVLFVVAGGGILEVLGDMPTWARRAVVVALIAFAVGRRRWRRRRRRRIQAAAVDGAASAGFHPGPRNT